MTNQLRQLAIDSICDYLHVFCPPANTSVPGIFPGFVINVVLNGSTVEFDPSLKGFEVHMYVCMYCYCTVQYVG